MGKRQLKWMDQGGRGGWARDTRANKAAPGSAAVDRQGEAEVEGKGAFICLFIGSPFLSGSRGGLSVRGSVLRHEKALTRLTF